MIPLFHPETRYWQECSDAVGEVLKTRWWGQANKVDEFEKVFSNDFNYQYSLSLNSGSAALELAYHLIGINEGDEVITPVLTCTATNIPLLRMKAKIVFADINRDTLLIDFKDVEHKITKKTKAIVAVTLGGLPIDKELFEIAKKYNIPVVIDAAQSLGISENYGDYITYSFQAIKHFSTGDGGMLIVRNLDEYKRAKSLRWFGIDREKKIEAGWQAWKDREMTIDIKEPGFKFHMNDINAAIGIVMMKYSDEILEYRKKLVAIYNQELKGIHSISGGSFWLYGVLINNRDIIANKLIQKGIDVNMVHLRNDIYSSFGSKRQNLPNMNYIEDKYLYLPLNTSITEEDVKRTIKLINEIVN
jgi:perosamine synthetase